MEQQAPPLTVEEFYEKSLKLNDVYRHNVAAMNKDFFEKQAKLFARLSEEDQETVKNMEIAKRDAAISKIIAPAKDLLDMHGRKITEH